ncbi:MAG: VOC family protein [Alicyclobacillus sp.]|nr:VOC family protein [Alicyclobacillus sp.]
MGVNRIDHVSINVTDLSTAVSFFVDLGLDVQAEWEMEGEWVSRLLGLPNVKTRCVALRAPDGQVWLELVKFYCPCDDPGSDPTARRPGANTPGIRHIALAVDDIDAMVAKLKERGAEILNDIQQYKNSYKLCYVRGPEDILLELAEDIKEDIK